MSGFAILLPRKVFSRERHALRIAVRDRRGEVKELEIRVAVAALDPEDEGEKLRAFVPQAEIDLKMRHRRRRARTARVRRPDRARRRRRRRGSARWPRSPRQVYPQFAGRARRQDADLAEAARQALAGETGRAFVLCLRAGDRLGADALMEFALDIVTRPEEDFHYADDLPPGPRARPRGRVSEAGMVAGPAAVDQLHRPRLVRRPSTSCAAPALPTARPRRLRSRVAADRGGAARSAARRSTLLETGPAQRRRRAGERRAAKRRWRGAAIAGGVRATAAPGVYRAAPALAHEGPRVDHHSHHRARRLHREAAWPRCGRIRITTASRSCWSTTSPTPRTPQKDG